MTETTLSKFSLLPKQTIWSILIITLLAIFYTVPVYVDYDFNDRGDTIYIWNIPVLMKIHTALLILWIAYCFSKNKTQKILRPVIVILSAFDFLIALTCFGAKHISPGYGSFLLFVYLPLILLSFPKVRTLTYNFFSERKSTNL